MYLNHPTWRTTEKFSAINTPHKTGINNSLRITIANTAIIPPIAKLPVSPINTFAGYELCHKNPIVAPTKAPINITNSDE